MNGVFAALLDILVPQKERARRTNVRTEDVFSLTITEHQLLGTTITTLLSYRSSAAQDLIRTLKYDASHRAASLAASLLADYLREECAARSLFSSRPILLVPLPLHSLRQKERGFNQIELVLRALPREFRDGTRATLAPNMLLRTRATPPQTKLSRQERLRNVRGAFAVPDTSVLAHADVFVIDDVTTTGATLAEAGKTLRKTGAKVTLLALARA